MFGLGNIGGVVKGIDKIMARFKMAPEKAEEIKLELEELLQRRDSEIEQTIRIEMQAKERILVAELAQGSSYTKAARPTVVYFGLAVIFFNYTVIPFLQWYSGSAPTPFSLPTEFWLAWGGIVATWSVGRSAERRGTRNRMTSMMTGNKSIILD